MRHCEANVTLRSLIANYRYIFRNCVKLFFITNYKDQANEYMFKVNNENIRKACQRRRSGVFIASLNIFLNFSAASIVDVEQINVIIYIIKPTSCLTMFTTSYGSCIYTGSYKMFWRKGYRRVNW